MGSPWNNSSHLANGDTAALLCRAGLGPALFPAPLCVVGVVHRDRRQRIGNIRLERGMEFDQLSRIGIFTSIVDDVIHPDELGFTRVG